MRLHRTLLGIAFASFFACAIARGDDLVVVVNAGSSVQGISREEAADIFLGRFRKLPSGESAVPIDNTDEMEVFYRRLVGRSLAEIGAYWAQLRFSGRTKPPAQAPVADALDRVANTPGAITYVDRSKVDKRVRVVLDLDR
jgi:ABC-type phosphate transport system substrate-binding protein